jgi:predicted lipid carrier protein YhbT
VQGSKRSRWLVTLDRGDIAVSRKNASADCAVRTGKALFEQLVSGRANAMAAVLRGAIAVEGDLELLLLFQRLFPGPPKVGGKRRAGRAGSRR